MNPDDIRKAQARYERAFARSEQTRRERDDAIRQGLSEGLSHGQVAKLLGGKVTRSRIGQIALGR